MKQNIILTFSLLFLICQSLQSQTDNVKGNLVSDTADLTILNIYPDSFPNVSVVFKAETRRGEPCWNLKKDKIQVQENGKNCNVISLEPISKNRPVNLGIVIDHSGSMAVDQSLFMDSIVDPRKIDSIFSAPGYKSPIENAKDAVKTFVSSFNITKDYVSITGFSSEVSQKLPLTHDTGIINSMIDSMRPDGGTALYDAMFSGLDELQKTNEVNVLIVLTDGYDNASRIKYKDVITRAQVMNIPIYIIGLGNANKDTLRMIANETKGQFYYTNKSSSLNDAYNDISKHIQAFYDLVYESPNLASGDPARYIRIWFQSDSIELITNISHTSLPPEVITYLKKKETERSYLLYGGIAIVGLIGAGVLLYKYKKNESKKKAPVVLNLYPNPGDGNITIDYGGSSGQLQVFDMNGQPVKQIAISEGSNPFDFSDLSNGSYIAIVNADGQKSNSTKFIIQK